MQGTCSLGFEPWHGERGIGGAWLRWDWDGISNVGLGWRDATRRGLGYLPQVPVCGYGPIT